MAEVAFYLDGRLYRQVLGTELFSSILKFLFVFLLARSFSRLPARSICTLKILFFFRQWLVSPYINHFIQPDSIIPNPSNPQSWNRYSYVQNSPINYSDPTGHRIDDGCLTEGCSLTQYQKDQDEQKLELLKKEHDKHKCKNGNENYCPTVDTHPVETVAFVATGLVAGPLAEQFFLGGGVDVAFWRLVQGCIGSAACRWVTGMAGGVGGYQSVTTPYGSAYQSTTQQALQTRDEVQGGANLYKMGTLGPGNGVESQFWSLENPLLNPHYAKQYGVPAQNLASGDNSFLLIGQIRDGATFVTREAPGFGSNVGGGIEAVVQEYGVKST